LPHLFRHALCNEIFEHRPLSKACRVIRRAGYSGLEIAPFTLAEDPATIPLGERRQVRATLASEGLQFVGLHWLMVSPKGLHVTTPDKALRTRSWLHILRLIDLCSDLGPGGVMVFGSPQQRAATAGIPPAEATRHLMDGLASVASHAGEHGVTILLEALPLAQCNVVTSLGDAVSIVRQIDHPAIQTMFDTHNAVDELEPHATLIERHFDVIRHVHVNEMDGRHPGTGTYNFKPVLAILRQRGYTGWVSLEAFDFSAGADKIASDSLRYLEAEIAGLHA
jgi:sugar phosphate isomerase/epimerase